MEKRMLGGIKVLSFTHYLQGPSAAQILADLGAEVVKIEPPNGAYERHWSGSNAFKNGVSAFFMMAHRNQRGMVIDLKAQGAAEVVRKIAADCDVVIQNFKVGVMERLGIGYEDLKSVNPGLVYCCCSGEGPTGPRAKGAGQDLLAQSISGLAAITGNGDKPPTPVGISVVDQHGATLAALGIITALFNRSRTGEGCRVDCSLLNAALDLQIESIAYYLNGGQLTERPATGLSTRFHQSPYGVYKTADSCLTVSLTPFHKLCEAFSPGALDDFEPRDQMENRIAFDRVVAAELLKRTTAEWISIFTGIGIWHAPVLDYREVFNDPQVIHNQVTVEVGCEETGAFTVLGHPNRYNGKKPGVRRNPPCLDEHTDEVLGEAGYGREQIALLRKTGIVGRKGTSHGVHQ